MTIITDVNLSDLQQYPSNPAPASSSLFYSHMANTEPESPPMQRLPLTNSLANNLTDAFYHTTSLLASQLTTPAETYYSLQHPPPTTATTNLNVSARQWHEYGGTSSSSYNVDSRGGGVGELGVSQGLLEGGSTFMEAHKEFVFDRTDVRVVFITLYSLVFCCCFFGEYRACFDLIRVVPLFHPFPVCKSIKTKGFYSSFPVHHFA